MSKRARVLSTALAGMAAAAAMALPATSAQAAVNPVYLYTAATLDECTASGDNGVRGRVFADYHCRSGFAGYSLNVTPTKRHGGSGYVHINTMKWEQCQAAGTNGMAGRVFSDFYCQLGFIDWILMVKD